MKDDLSFYIQDYNSPVGKLKIVTKNNKLHALVFAKNWSQFKNIFTKTINKETKISKVATLQLNQYFTGKRIKFNLPIEMHGTDFQKRVWKSLDSIPFGETRTYKEQAKSINSQNAVRAVGRTNGLNPFCIILPCHRVIGSDGKLTGYAAGLRVKKFLLELEGAI